MLGSDKESLLLRKQPPVSVPLSWRRVREMGMMMTPAMALIAIIYFLS
jgi:hypothetical protein